MRSQNIKTAHITPGLHCVTLWMCYNLIQREMCWCRYWEIILLRSMMGDAERETNIALQMPFYDCLLYMFNGWFVLHNVSCYPPCPARRDPGDLLIVIGTVWRFLMCVWSVLSRVSDPAAMPSERAVRYRARQAAEARPRMRVSEQDCQSASLQPPNIFPERERRDTRALQHTCLPILLTYTHLLKEEALKIQKSASQEKVHPIRVCLSSGI